MTTEQLNQAIKQNEILNDKKASLSYLKKEDRGTYNECEAVGYAMKKLCTEEQVAIIKTVLLAFGEECVKKNQEFFDSI